MKKAELKKMVERGVEACGGVGAGSGVGAGGRSGWRGRTGWSERASKCAGGRGPPHIFGLLKFGQLGFG